MAFPLLLLPRELRDQIYLEYLTVAPDGAYVFDFQSGKLRTSDGRPIDLALMYTCTLVAREMRGMALRTQTIIFRTVYSDGLRATAGCFDYLIRDYHCNVRLALYGLRDFIDEEKLHVLGGSYPELIPILRRIFDEGSPSTIQNLSYGEVPSLSRAAIRQALCIWSQDDSLCEHLFKIDGLKKPHEAIRRCISLFPEPWIIPTESELLNMSDMRAYRSISSASAYREYWCSDGGKYRFSAAAAAIHFLHSIPNARCHIRNIVLDEDHDSVAFPESHILGLIPFGRENPALHIIRRASLWNNVFQNIWPHCSNWEWRISDQRNVNLLSADEITRSVATWMAEAAVLGRMGMPEAEDRFILILDGDPTPERTSEIFDQIVQRDAAWQEAMVRRFAVEHPEDPEGVVMYDRDSYFFRAFPQLLKDLVCNRNSGTIRCNFDPGKSQDADALFAMHPDWDFEEWDEAWKRDDVGFATQPPLPNWSEMMRSNVLHM